MKRVLGIGACVLDTVISCGEYPAEDTKLRAEQAFRTGGGPVSNALVALARLGVGAEYAGALPEGPDGRLLAEEFARFGVGTEYVRFVPARAFTSFVILSGKSGSRTCIYERGSIPDDPQSVPEQAIARADILHLDGNFLRSALRAARFARGRGIPVSLDAGGLYEGIEELLPLVDVLIPSEEFAKGITGAPTAEEAVRILQARYRPQRLVVTQGARGGVFADGDKTERFNGFRVSCADSNGAGDTFHGAFLAAALAGKDIRACCRYAAAAAALKCTKVGVRNALPTDKEVIAFMEEHIC